MSFLGKVVSGIVDQPDIILLYGTPKIGKTTFATSAPNSIIIDIEGGSHRLNVKRLLPKNYHDVIAMLTELATVEHPYKTIVLDSLDHLEPWVWAVTCKRYRDVTSIQEVGGGYNKGYEECLKEWAKIIELLKACRNKGINIICLAHAHVKTVNDPTKSLAYDKFELKFNPKASALFKENADMIFFAHKEIAIRADSKTKGKALGEARHVLYTSGMPGYEGGSRYALPAEMDLKWEVFEEALLKAKNPESRAEELRALIAQEMASISDVELAKKIADQTAGAQNDTDKLEKIYKRILEIKKGNS